MNTLRLAAMTLLVTCALTAHAQFQIQTCPFEVPVRSVAPHSMNGYSWGNPVRPMGDPCVAHMAIDSVSGGTWYVGGHTGLYLTRNSGLTWTKPLAGNVGAVLVVPGDGLSVQLVYAAIGTRLYMSRDSGYNWIVLKTFNTTIRSLLAANGKLYTGLHWGNHVDPSGIWISTLLGGSMTFKPFGPGHTGLIVWTISRNPNTSVLFAGTEIFDHPQPYHPPFFRSSDGGNTWTNVAGSLPWHVIASDVRPTDGYLYALTEGMGLHGSSNNGTNWIPPAQYIGLGMSMLMDPQVPSRLYFGRHSSHFNGGLHRSNDGGQTYIPIGLQGITPSDMKLNAAGTRLYVVSYASGLYWSPVP